MEFVGEGNFVGQFLLCLGAEIIYKSHECEIQDGGKAVDFSFSNRNPFLLAFFALIAWQLFGLKISFEAVCYVLVALDVKIDFVKVACLTSYPVTFWTLSDVRKSTDKFVSNRSLEFRSLRLGKTRFK